MDPEKPSQDKSKLNQKFTVAEIGDAEQKRQQAIASIREQEQRKQLEAMDKERKKKMEEVREQAKKREEAAVKEETDERERAKQKFILTPIGAKPMSREQIEKDVISDVRQSLGAQLDKQLDHYERQLNQQLDRKISAAQDKEQGRAGPPRSQWKNNAQDVTAAPPKRPDLNWKQGPVQAKPPERSEQNRDLKQTWEKTKSALEPEQSRDR